MHFRPVSPLPLAHVDPLSSFSCIFSGDASMWLVSIGCLLLRRYLVQVRGIAKEVVA